MLQIGHYYCWAHENPLNKWSTLEEGKKMVATYAEDDTWEQEPLQ